MPIRPPPQRRSSGWRSGCCSGSRRSSAADPPDGIVIDSAGADHLHGGEPAMLATLVEKLAGVGLRARTAIADSWGAAHALARFAARPSVISAPGDATTDVAPLPIAALRLASDLVDTLRVLGFERVGELALSRAPLNCASARNSAAASIRPPAGSPIRSNRSAPGN
jgi:nucleotidyltransferase/DNA polymerase involved in DNA repair